MEREEAVEAMQKADARVQSDPRRDLSPIELNGRSVSPHAKPDRPRPPDTPIGFPISRRNGGGEPKDCHGHEQNKARGHHAIIQPTDTSSTGRGASGLRLAVARDEDAGGVHTCDDVSDDDDATVRLDGEIAPACWTAHVLGEVDDAAGEIGIELAVRCEAYE